MDASYNKAEFMMALKIGLVCGISVAIIELYYLLVGAADPAISTPVYQTLWLLTAFIFALAGILTAYKAANIKNISGVVLYSGLAGAVAGILYMVSVDIVEFIRLLINSMQYFYMPTFLTDTASILISSVLWLPVAMAIAIFGGVVYAVLTKKV